MKYLFTFYLANEKLYYLRWFINIYHAFVKDNSIEKIKEYKEKMNSQNFVQKYKDEKNKKYDYCIENYDTLKNAIDDMLKKFKENLEFQLKDLKNYKLKWWSFWLRI